MTGHLWALTDHVCVACLGRVLEREVEGAAPVFRCSNCGVEAQGRPDLAHPPICACGAKLGKRDAGIRCLRNPHPRPELLCEVVARELGGP